MKITQHEAEVLKAHLEFILRQKLATSADPSLRVTMDITDRLDVVLGITGCTCDGWGCLDCCDDEAELRSKQGIFG